MRSCESRYRRLAPWASQRTMLSDFIGMAPGRGWGKLRGERQWGGMNGAGGGRTKERRAKAQRLYPERYSKTAESAAFLIRRARFSPTYTIFSLKSCSF